MESDSSVADLGQKLATALTTYVKAVQAYNVAADRLDQASVAVSNLKAQIGAAIDSEIQKAPRLSGSPSLLSAELKPIRPGMFLGEHDVIRAMQPVQLYTRNGGFVVSGHVPPFQPGLEADIIVWGDRTFALQPDKPAHGGPLRYVEVFAVALVDADRALPSPQNL